MEDPAGPAPGIISGWEISSVVGYYQEGEDMNHAVSAMGRDIFQRREWVHCQSSFAHDSPMIAIWCTLTESPETASSSVRAETKKQTSLPASLILKSCSPRRERDDGTLYLLRRGTGLSTNGGGRRSQAQKKQSVFRRAVFD